VKNIKNVGMTQNENAKMTVEFFKERIEKLEKYKNDSINHGLIKSSIEVNKILLTLVMSMK